MYPAVPTDVPDTVNCSTVGWRSPEACPFGTMSTVFARPKSSTFTMPARVTKMFAGLMSR